MNVYAKFRNFPLRINKALGIFRIGVTRTTSTRTRTTRVAFRDAFQRLKISPITRRCSNVSCITMHTVAQHCINSNTSHSYRKGQNSTLYKIETLERIEIKFGHLITSPTLFPKANLVTIGSVGLLGECVKYTNL